MPVLLFIKAQLIWATHRRVISFRVLHDLQKTWKITQKYVKFCNIIVVARCDILLKIKMIKHLLCQCCYLSKRNSFEPLMGEL